MKVLFINNDGGGFADYVDVPEGTTITKFFEDKVPERKASEFLIRINRQPAAADQVLMEKDKISITPLKIEGM